MLFFFRNPKKSSFAKARHQIVARWLVKSKSKSFMVAFTSRLRREGVSTVALGVARSFSLADMGKVLLLNAGLKHPRKAKQLNLAEQQDFSDLSEFITRDKKSNCDIIRLANTARLPRLPSGSFGDEAEMRDASLPQLDIRFDEDGGIYEYSLESELWAEQYQRLLKKIEATYNIILVDAGSLNNRNGTFWLANSDVNILVIDCSKTTREILEHQQREFENSQITIHGSILNKRKFPIPSFLYWLAR